MIKANSKIIGIIVLGTFDKRPDSVYFLKAVLLIMTSISIMKKTAVASPVVVEVKRFIKL